MRDEKSSGNTFNLNAVPSCIDEPVKAMLNPGANQIGTLFGDLLAMATSKIHFSAEKMRLQQTHDLEEFKKSLGEKLNAKPAECLVEPRMQVVGPALENAKFCLEEPQISKMFQNLLANAADSRYQKQIHPSFSSMIAQLSPLDAENLVLISKKSSIPIVNYDCIYTNGGHQPIFENCFIENSAMTTPDELERQAESLSALQRQGLIEISYIQWRKDERVYSAFRETSIYKEAEESIAQAKKSVNLNDPKLNIADKVDFQKGLVELTPLGRAFTAVCFKS